MRRATVLAVLALGLAAVASSQESKSAPRLPNGKPDLSGVWDRPYVPDMTKNSRNQRGYPELPFTKAGLENWLSYDAANGDYTGSCMPFGMTRSFNSPYPVQIVQNTSAVALLFEQNTWFHVVPIDGRPMPKDPDPTWFGTDRKSTRLNSSHIQKSRMPSSA